MGGSDLGYGRPATMPAKTHMGASYAGAGFTVENEMVSAGFEAVHRGPLVMGSIFMVPSPGRASQCEIFAGCIRGAGILHLTDDVGHGWGCFMGLGSHSSQNMNRHWNGFVCGYGSCRC